MATTTPRPVRTMEQKREAVSLAEGGMSPYKAFVQVFGTEYGDFARVFMSVFRRQVRRERFESAYQLARSKDS